MVDLFNKYWSISMVDYGLVRHYFWLNFSRMKVNTQLIVSIESYLISI